MTTHEKLDDLKAPNRGTLKYARLEKKMTYQKDEVHALIVRPNTMTSRNVSGMGMRGGEFCVANNVD